MNKFADHLLSKIYILIIKCQNNYSINNFTSLQQKKIEIIQKQGMNTPQHNTPIQSRSGVRIVTSLGIYSNSNMEQKNKHILNSAKTIRQMICINNNEQQQQSQEQTKDKAHTSRQSEIHNIKSEQIVVRNGTLMCDDEEVRDSQRSLGKIIGQTNLRKVASYSNHVLTQSSSSNIGECKQYNRQLYSGVQHNCRQSQILSNKYKSNIVYLQNQIKEIIKLTLFSSCLDEQKEVRQELITLESAIRKLKLNIKQVKGSEMRVKQNMKRLRELTVLINQQKKINSQLQLREKSLEQYIQSRKSIDPFFKKQRNSKFITQSQESSSKLASDSEIIGTQSKKASDKIASRYMDQVDIEQANKQISGITQIYEVREAGFGGITQEQSQCSSQSYHFKQKMNQKKSKFANQNQILQMTNNSENTLNIYYDRVIRDSHNSHISQYSDIIKQTKHHPKIQRISHKFNQNLSTKFKFKPQKSKIYGKSSEQYRKLLEQRIKILKQGIKFCVEDYDKKIQNITKQKICIRKNIELFKLDTLKIEADNRKLNKFLIKKDNQNINSLFSQASKRNSLSLDRRIKTMENSQQRKLGNDRDVLSSSRKLIYWQTRKVYAMNKQQNISPSSHKSLSRRSSSRSLQSTGYLKCFRPHNQQKINKFCNSPYQNNRVYANNEYFGEQ